MTPSGDEEETPGSGGRQPTGPTAAAAASQSGPSESLAWLQASVADPSRAHATADLDPDATTRRAGGASAPQPVSLVGRQVGPWIAEQELGRGGMGVVLRARHAADGRVAALKVLLAGAEASLTQRRRFEREAEAVEKLSHPGVVRLLEHGVADGLPYLALEFVDGQPLSRLIDRLSLEDVVAVLAEVARAVEAIHARGLVHRDLKPHNVIVRASDRRPLVTDFGLARDLTLTSSLTTTGQLLGTPYYMAPEQAQGQRDRIGPATDVWALGVMLYQGLTGDVPYRHVESAVQLIQAIVHERPEPPSQRNHRVPAELEEVCLRALEKEPSRRYAGAGEMAAALEGWLDLRQGRARPAVRGPAARVALGALLVAIAATAVAWFGRGAGRGGAPPAPMAGSGGALPAPDGPHLAVESGPPQVEVQTGPPTAEPVREAPPPAAERPPEPRQEEVAARVAAAQEHADRVARAAARQAADAALARYRTVTTWDVGSLASCYEAARQLDPTYGRVAFEHALQLARLGEHLGALIQLDLAAAAEDPYAGPPYLALRGRILWALGRREESLEALRAAEAAAPGADSEVGRLLEEAGREPGR